MILGVNQPYFIPYLGYWQLINAVDTFIIADDYKYIMRGWINRNRILSGDKYFGLEIKSASRNSFINELYINDFLANTKLKTIYHTYHKAPYFEEGYSLVKEILTNEERNLSLFLSDSIKLICKHIGIETAILKTSDFAGNIELKRERKIYDLCKRMKADSYYNAAGGQKLYSYKDFENQGIRLGFIKTRNIRYEQFNKEFEPNLSIIDVIMFNDINRIKEFLKEFDLIENGGVDNEQSR
ncbi:MAG: WbqC family protein [Suipraeoptans sp.]